LACFDLSSTLHSFFFNFKFASKASFFTKCYHVAIQVAFSTLLQNFANLNYILSLGPNFEPNVTFLEKIDFNNFVLVFLTHLASKKFVRSYTSHFICAIVVYDVLSGLHLIWKCLDLLSNGI
jgi:hypothetical protein